MMRMCRKAGHEVVVTAPDLREAWSFLSQENVKLMQAPALRPGRRRRAPPICYADLLLHEGYDDPIAFEGALQGWESVLDFVKPDLLVYDHAPTALIAARPRGVPAFLSGTGFEIPPGYSPLPSFRPWEAIDPSRLVQAERRCLDRINDYLEHRGQSRLSALFELFAASPIDLVTFAELDPFGPREGVRYVGPVHTLSAMSRVAWRYDRRHRILTYIRPTVPGCEHLLAAMQQLDAEVLCVAPGMPADWPARFEGLRLIDHPIDLSVVLPDASLAVLYGSSTIAIALQAGVPVLLVPQMIEQYLTGLALERSGAGLMLRETRTRSTCLDLLGRLVNTETYRNAAASFARKYSGFTSTTSAEFMYESLKRQLESK